MASEYQQGFCIWINRVSYHVSTCHTTRYIKLNVGAVTSKCGRDGYEQEAERLSDVMRRMHPWEVFVVKSVY
jgi:hypothetical protein